MSILFIVKTSYKTSEVTHFYKARHVLVLLTVSACLIIGKGLISGSILSTRFWFSKLSIKNFFVSLMTSIYDNYKF